MFIRLLALFAFLSSPLAAEEVVLGMSQNRVAITANFDGSEILLFGAVKRESAIQQEPPLEVVIAVAGPSHPVTVRYKEKKFGIWINTENVEVDEAPSFYAAQAARRVKRLSRKSSCLDGFGRTAQVSKYGGTT